MRNYNVKPVASQIFEEGGWEIFEEDDAYVLEVIPLYGGCPSVYGIYDTLEEALEISEELT